MVCYVDVVCSGQHLHVRSTEGSRAIHTIFLLSGKHRVGTNQRDQMLELKVAKFSPKLSQKVTTLVLRKMAQKAYFCN